VKRRLSQNIVPVLLVLAVAIIFLIIILYKAPIKAEAQVAFVLDDWGYSLNNVDALFQIDRPVTLAVLPHLRYSKEISDRVIKYGRGYDIILHLPLESKSGKAPERDTIRRNMEKNRVLSILKDDIESIPGIIGEFVFKANIAGPFGMLASLPKKSIAIPLFVKSLSPASASRPFFLKTDIQRFML